MTPEKLDELYALAKAAQEMAYNSQNPQAVEDFNDAISTDVVTALINRVRELEGALQSVVEPLDIAQALTEKSYHHPKILAAYERARAALNKEQS